MPTNPTSSDHRRDQDSDRDSDRGGVMADSRPMVALTEHTVAALAEVLSLTEEFLRTAGPNVHAELRGYLRAQWPPADPTWLIDMLGFHGLHLRHQLPTPASAPRENWQPGDHHVDHHVDADSDQFSVPDTRPEVVR